MLNESIQKMLEKVLLARGDYYVLDDTEKKALYLEMCQSLGLNPTSFPFEYIEFDGKLKLYAKKDATDQLRKIHGISISIAVGERVADCYLITAKATDKEGRTDESVGVVSMKDENPHSKKYGEYLTGTDLANAIMKAETKAKRRVTLSICGLGILDEVELETMQSARIVGITSDYQPIEAQQPTTTYAAALQAEEDQPRQENPIELVQPPGQEISMNEFELNTPEDEKSFVEPFDFSGLKAINQTMSFVASKPADPFETDPFKNPPVYGEGEAENDEGIQPFFSSVAVTVQEKQEEESEQESEGLVTTRELVITTITRGTQGKARIPYATLSCVDPSSGEPVDVNAANEMYEKAVKLVEFEPYKMVIEDMNGFYKLVDIVQ